MKQSKTFASGFPVEAIETLRQQLAEKDAEVELERTARQQLEKLLHRQAETISAIQAREQQLREAYVLLENFAQSVGGSSSFWEDMNDKLEPASVIANFEKADTSALEAMIAKAGEVMRGRFHSLLHSAQKSSQ